MFYDWFAALAGVARQPSPASAAITNAHLHAEEYGTALRSNGFVFVSN
jgi:hypothetical protein